MEQLVILGTYYTGNHNYRTTPPTIVGLPANITSVNTTGLCEVK
jgi:hypothetical protein